jgi:hypothetical protein
MRIQDLLSTQEKLSKAEVRCQHLAAEKEVLKVAEVRLQKEMESLLRNHRSRDELDIRLESIQVSN